MANLDINRYSELKKKGTISLIKAGGVVALVQRRFDTESGEALPDEVVGVNLKELRELRAKLVGQIATLDVVLADCDEVLASKVV